MEPLLKILRLIHINLNSPIRKILLLLMLVVKFLFIFFLETQYAVVKHVAKKNKWNMILDPLAALNFDLCWIDGIARQDIFTRMNPYQKINHFPGIFSYIQVWVYSQEKITSAKISCSLGKNFLTNMSSFLSHGIFLRILLI